MPYQPGSMHRDCVHENTHGIALRFWMPDLERRDAGREPIRILSIRSIGVASRK